MITIKGKNFVYFDVDDTLINWNRRDTENSFIFTIPDSGGVWCMEANWDIVRKLKEHKRNGDTVVVWSQGGWDWAEEVVSVLNLQQYVDVIMSKPHRYYDDLHCSVFMEDIWMKVKNNSFELIRKAQP